MQVVHFCNSSTNVVKMATVINVIFSLTEFITKFKVFDLGNLDAGLGSLMINRVARLPEGIIDLPVWKYIIIMYLIYMLGTVLISVIGLIVSKKCRGNMEAFVIMGVLLVGLMVIA